MVWWEIKANLPEVFPVPPEVAQSDGSVRVWRLPSGRMIISDLDGNLEQIAGSLPRLARQRPHRHKQFPFG